MPGPLEPPITRIDRAIQHTEPQRRHLLRQQKILRKQSILAKPAKLRKPLAIKQQKHPRTKRQHPRRQALHAAVPAIQQAIRPVAILALDVNGKTMQPAATHAPNSPTNQRRITQLHIRIQEQHHLRIRSTHTTVAAHRRRSALDHMDVQPVRKVPRNLLRAIRRLCISNEDFGMREMRVVLLAQTGQQRRQVVGFVLCGDHQAQLGTCTHVLRFPSNRW